ncbi:MAG: TolB family protein [Acidimicrobiales bacterium]
MEAVRRSRPGRFFPITVCLLLGALLGCTNAGDGLRGRAENGTETARTPEPDRDRALDRLLEPSESAAEAGVDGRPDRVGDGGEAATFGAEDPSASPFLFSSDRSGVFQVYLRRGDEVTPLTDDPTMDSVWPRLSPDGTMVMMIRSPVEARPAFGSVDTNHGAASLWTMRFDGSGAEQQIPATTFDQLGPANWSPDGLEVVFAATDPLDGRFRLWIADADRFAARPITSRDGLLLDPAFGPDGRRLAYAAYPAGHRGGADDFERLEVFVANADGSQETRLTFDELQDQRPSWSKDGEVIVFETAVDPDYLFVGKWDLRSVSPAGGAVTTVLADGNVNSGGRWHRSEAGLFFQRFVFGGEGRRLAYIDSDGSGLTTFGSDDAPYDDINIDPVPVALGGP